MKILAGRQCFLYASTGRVFAFSLEIRVGRELTNQVDVHLPPGRSPRVLQPPGHVRLAYNADHNAPHEQTPCVLRQPPKTAALPPFMSALPP
eukprot:3693718-Rhodomonas_salina.1